MSRIIEKTISHRSCYVMLALHEFKLFNKHSTVLALYLKYFHFALQPCFFMQFFFNLEREGLYLQSFRKYITFGNKAKGRISKLVLQENKARQVFRKTNISYPRLRIRGKKCSFFFQKIWRALFSWNTRFEIYPFTVLPTKHAFYPRYYDDVTAWE